MTRRAPGAAAVVRRTTLTLLEAMLPNEDPAELFGALRALPFAELGAQRLVVHDTVRTATSALLRQRTRRGTTPTAAPRGPGCARS